MAEASLSKLDEKGVFTIISVENVERKVGKETIFSKDELPKVFGFRKISNKIRPQSWCRSCRKIKP